MTVIDLLNFEIEHDDIDPRFIISNKFGYERISYYLIDKEIYFNQQLSQYSENMANNKATT